MGPVKLNEFITQHQEAEKLADKASPRKSFDGEDDLSDIPANSDGHVETIASVQKVPYTQTIGSTKQDESTDGEIPEQNFSDV